MYSLRGQDKFSRMEHQRYSSSFKMDLFSNLPVLDEWWKRLYGFQRFFVTLVVTWVPLLIFSILSGDFIGDGNKATFIYDYGVHLRFIIAMPILLISCLKTSDKAERILKHFIDAEILAKSDYEKFSSEISKTVILRDSLLAKVLIIIFIYVSALIFLLMSSQIETENWRSSIINGKYVISAAGGWFFLVSQPLYFCVLFHFLYRTFLWSRLMFQISRMKLSIKTTHGDDMGGLGFLSQSTDIFFFPIFAISLSVAGGLVNLVLYENLGFSEVKMIIGLFVSIVMILFLGPLFFFFIPLKRARDLGMLSYGVMLGKELTVFEKRWLKSSPDLKAEDFQTIDASISTVRTVHSMKLVPIRISNLVLVLTATVVPFLPAILMRVQWRVLFQQLVKVIL